MQSTTDLRILVLGASGFLGRSICSRLEQRGITPAKASLSLGTDFRDYTQIHNVFAKTQPRMVMNCAAFVGGIQFGYDHPIDIFNNNLFITLNIYRACAEFGIARLINPISNCIYPSKATIFREDEVWDGPLDESVLVYAMARKMHWVGAWAYHQEMGLNTINLVLPNMYGPGDHFDPIRSHALGGLISKIVQATRNHEPKVSIWGSGKPVREWLYVDDGADAMLSAMTIQSYKGLINVGTGTGISILELATMIKKAVGYEGELELDPSRPDGAPHKTLDGSRAKQMLGWKPAYTLEVGLQRTIDWFLSHHTH